MHTRNIHKSGYDFDALKQKLPALKSFVKKAPNGRDSVDFSNPNAVKCLNQALLLCYYNLDMWDIPPNFLCPAVPGRADYIHHIADLLAGEKGLSACKGKHIKGLDIGVGANVIYPIIGSQSYGWQFVGAEVDSLAYTSAKHIVTANPALKPLVKIRQQKDPNLIFDGIISAQDSFTFTMCNPPFHRSESEATQGSIRKKQNLEKNSAKRRGRNTQNKEATLNFAGQSNELWCEGGEAAFIRKMIEQSKHYGKQVEWFTTLVSQKSHLKNIEHLLRYHKASRSNIIPMEQGSKSSRMVAWQFKNT